MPVQSSYRVQRHKKTAALIAIFCCSVSRNNHTGKPTGPDFNLANGQGYMLDRSYTAAYRLNFQFYLRKASLRFNIHPSIPVPAQKACIADVATGTAIWLIDVASEIQTAQ